MWEKPHIWGKIILLKLSPLPNQASLIKYLPKTSTYIMKFKAYIYVMEFIKWDIGLSLLVSQNLEWSDKFESITTYLVPSTSTSKEFPEDKKPSHQRNLGAVAGWNWLTQTGNYKILHTKYTW